MEFQKVVFYARPAQRSIEMYGLDLEELASWRGARVLDCPGGPGALSALLRETGLEVTACDPVYALGPEELRQRALADLEQTLTILRASTDLRPEFDLEAMRREHLKDLETFLADRQAHPDRYLAASLPELPFADGSFDLVLSGHLLFSYAPIPEGGLMAGAGLDLHWHRRALAELRRVSRQEVRLYPVHTIERQARRHPYAATLVAELPAPWQGRFQPTRFDQGFDGCVEGLLLTRT